MEDEDRLDGFRQGWRGWGRRGSLNIEEIYTILLLDVPVFQYEYALDIYMHLNCVCQLYVGVITPM